MALKITGLEAAITSLAQTHKRMTDEATREMEKGAKAIQERAQLYAPLDVGDLEAAIQVEEVTSTFAKSQQIVYVDDSVAEYSTYMHEGQYNLGPRSAAKAQATGALVGPKFLSRAANELFPKITKAISAALLRVK